MENVHKQLIVDWFWSTTFSRRYSSSTLTRQKEDADWIASIVAGKLTPRIFSITTDLRELLGIQMKQRSVVKNGVLCILAANRPVDFNNGQTVNIDMTNVSRANAKENHHFFPFSRREELNICDSESNSLLNFAFISKSLNGKILNKLPSQYLLQYKNQSSEFPQWMLSHFIDEKALEAAENDDFKAFADIRGKLLLKTIYERCRQNPPALVVPNDEMEIEDVEDEENSVDSGNM